MSVSLKAAVLAAGVSIFGFGQLQAATCVGTERSFGLVTSPDASCYAVAMPGQDNISGNGSGRNPDPLIADPLTDLIFLDKFERDQGKNQNGILSVSTVKGLAGTFSIDLTALMPPVGKEFYNFIIGIKSGGNGGKQSVWAAFALPSGVLQGDWTISGKQALSHMNLYAMTRQTVAPPPPAPVPLPAAGFMLVAAIAGLGLLRRKR